MATISDDDITHLATLSSLELSPSEAESLRIDLENIITHVDALGALDTSGVKPTYQVTGLENVMRKDIVDASSLSGSDLVQLAPASRNNLIEVPKVL